MRTPGGPGAVAVAAAALLLAAGCTRRRQAPPPPIPAAAPTAPNPAVTTAPTPHREPAAFTDEVGRRVRPRNVPTRRVVSLAPNVTELMFAIGAGAQVVGIDNYSDQPAGAVDRITRVGSNYEPSLEKIVALSPDVVLTSLSANRRETAEALERVGIPVFVTDTRAIADMDRIFRNLGALTGQAREAEQQIGRLHGGFEAVRRQVPPTKSPRVLVVVWDEPLYVAGRHTFVDDLIRLCGGTNIATDAQGFAKYPLERVLRSAPEVIVLPTHSTEEQGPRAMAYWSRWSDLPAVKARRVHPVDDAIISRPGARLVEGAHLLFRLLHPGAPPP